MADLSLSGNYAAIQAQALKAYEQAKANVATQKAQLLQRYGYNPNGQLDPTNQYGLYQQNERSYSRQKDDLVQARMTALTGSGLDENGNLRGDTPYGGYQQLLYGQGLQLDSARDNALSRGLGTHGAGAQAGQRLLYGQAAQRSDFRQQLVDRMTQLKKSQEDVDYQHGLGQYTLGQELAGGVSQLDNALYDATTNYNSTLSNGLLQDILDRINAGDFTPVTSGDPVSDSGGDGNGAGGGTKATGPTPHPATAVDNASAAALAAARKKGATPAMAALAARSAGLNTLYKKKGR